MYSLRQVPKTKKLLHGEKPEKTVARPPFLRWAGSKRRLLPKLAPFWGGGHSRYVEPFAGSAALFFALRPACALLSDANEDLIETFTLVRDTPELVYDALSSLPLGKDSFYRLRARNPKRLTPLNRVARFIFLNRFCFNGLYRTNAVGEFNVPYAPTGTGAIPSRQQFLSTASLLRATRLRSGDFDEILRDEVQTGDFVYLDPPYAVANRRIFRQYGPQTFGLNDLERLGDLLEEIDRRGAAFVLSYAWCNEANSLVRSWRKRRVYTQRNIAGFARHRRMAAELIVTNIEPCRVNATNCDEEKLCG
jgi:DNA adenine methylase